MRKDALEISHLGGNLTSSCSFLPVIYKALTHPLGPGDHVVMGIGLGQKGSREGKNIGWLPWTLLDALLAFIPYLSVIWAKS